MTKNLRSKSVESSTRTRTMQCAKPKQVLGCTTSSRFSAVFGIKENSGNESNLYASAEQNCGSCKVAEVACVLGSGLY